MIGCLLAASGAQASDSSVRAAIEASSRQVKESSELQGALSEFKSDPKDLAKLQKGIATFVGALKKVEAKVSAQKASTSKGKQGEADWLGGIRKVAKGFEDLNTTLSDIKSGNKSAAKSELKQAVTLVKQGAVEAKEGKALLGVKKT
ncbi:MAG TPA: hypothetical protein VK761_10060 [Solirubrobacteraceae bacterium]|nr:hypothetical protein [Solirubrobacteraceae bacterium]